MNSTELEIEREEEKQVRMIISLSVYRSTV